MSITFVSPKRGLKIIIEPATYKRDRHGDRKLVQGKSIQFIGGQYVARSDEEIKFLDNYAQTHQDIVSRIDKRALHVLSEFQKVMQQQSNQSIPEAEFNFAGREALEKIVISDEAAKKTE
jgi:hypothetical protein